MTTEFIQELLLDLCNNKLEEYNELDFYKESSFNEKLQRVLTLDDNEDLYDILIKELPDNSLKEKFRLYLPYYSPSYDDLVKYYEKYYFSIKTYDADGAYVQLRFPTGICPYSSLSYRLNNGEWIEIDLDDINKNNKVIGLLTLFPNDILEFKGTRDDALNNNNDYINFQLDCDWEVFGNVMSLIYGDKFKYYNELKNNYSFFKLFENNYYLIHSKHLILPSTSLTEYCYANMFANCTSLTTAPELPATTLAPYSYANMFYYCSSLTSAPELHATTLANYCYAGMFSGCTSLTTAPELPATTLANNCYVFMFYDCTSLESAPELPATTLTNYCYNSMFQGCTSLTSAPELPATTLATSCYAGMFNGCSKLNYVKALFITTPGNDYTNNWLSGVSSTGIFIKNSSATWNVSGASGIPLNWTVQTVTT